jgi:hypothetical protein
MEAFRIFPMSNVESWSMLQRESNDIRNLTLDALKQNIMPVTKVVRGKNVDLDQLKRRGQGSAVMVQNKDDVTWEQTPTFPSQVVQMTQKLDIEFDDLSGQQNYGTINDNNNLGKTLGGLKLAAGAANAVQEFDIRVWIETWVEPVLSQIVKLEQYYESDPTVLELCGERAKLFQKFGVDQITDDMLERSIAVRVNAGLGAGDPQQRLAKFQSAVQVAMPLLQLSPDFAQQKVVMDWEAVMEEVFGAAGYRDGGRASSSRAKASSKIRRWSRSSTRSRPRPRRTAPPPRPPFSRRSPTPPRSASPSRASISNGSKPSSACTSSTPTSSAARSTWASSHGHELSDRKKAASGLNPDGSPMLPPSGASPTEGGSGGASPTGAANGVAASGGAGIPQNAGHGNAGMDPAMLTHHGVPASDAGHQGGQDEAAAAAQIKRSAKNSPLAQHGGLMLRSAFRFTNALAGPETSSTRARRSTCRARPRPARSMGRPIITAPIVRRE